MKRFLRWPLVGIAGLILATWIVSYFKTLKIEYATKWDVIDVSIEYGVFKYNRYSGFWQDFSGVRIRHTPVSNVEYFGLTQQLILPTANTDVTNIYDSNLPITFQVQYLYLPAWFCIGTLIPFLAIIWYRNIRAWWRGENRKGFEVALKDNSELPSPQPSPGVPGEGARK